MNKPMRTYSAYFKAQRSKKAQDRSDRTAAAPKIYRLRKDGQRNKAPMDQGIHRWETVAEAEAVAAYMMQVNPGATYVVVQD